MAMWGREHSNSGRAGLDRKQECPGAAPPLKDEKQAPTIGLHDAADRCPQEQHLRFLNYCAETERIHGTNYTEGRVRCKGGLASKRADTIALHLVPK